MAEDKTFGVERRQFLKGAAGAAGAGAIAGCAGDGDDGGDEVRTVIVTREGERVVETVVRTPGQEEFPSRDLTAVIYASPGGGYDFYTRLLAKHLPNHLPGDHEVAPQNITGAGGRIAMQQVFAKDDDAHTFMIMNLDRFPRNQVLYDLQYDLMDFTYYPQVAIEERLVGAAPGTGITTWEEFATAMENEELTIGTSGLTSGPMMVLVVIGELTGRWSTQYMLDNHVVYDGTADVALASQRGDVDTIAGSYASILDYVQNEQTIPVLYVTMEDEPPEEILEINPDCDTLATADVENGPQIQDTVRSGRGFGGPPNVPEEHANVMRQAITDALNDDALLQEAEEAGRPIVYGPSEQTRAVVQAKLDTWQENSDVLLQLTGGG